MRQPGVLRSKDLPRLTARELRATLAECGPSVESAQAILARGESLRRAERDNRRLKIASMILALLAALITVLATRWHEFSWWITHQFKI
jgi:hypothetical protein